MAETKAYIQELADKDGNKVYPVTKAEAVYMKDNATTLDKQIETMQQSFQDGVDTLVNKLKSLGVTPEENSPAGIAAAIEVLAQNKFNDGVASIKIPATVSITTNGGAGQENYDIADGYYTEAVVDQSGAYNAGRLQGREDVKANPNGYGFYTEDQYNAFGGAKYNEGVAAGKNSASARASCSVDLGLNKEDVYNANGYVSGSCSATAVLSNGKLSVSISGSVNLRVVAWEGGNPTYSGESNKGLGSSGSGNVS